MCPCRIFTTSFWELAPSGDGMSANTFWCISMHNPSQRSQTGSCSSFFLLAFCFLESLAYPFAMADYGLQALAINSGGHKAFRRVCSLGSCSLYSVSLSLSRTTFECNFVCPSVFWSLSGG